MNNFEKKINDLFKAISSKSYFILKVVIFVESIALLIADGIFTYNVYDDTWEFLPTIGAFLGFTFAAFVAVVTQIILLNLAEDVHLIRKSIKKDEE